MAKLSIKRLSAAAAAAAVIVISGIAGLTYLAKPTAYSVLGPKVGNALNLQVVKFDFPPGTILQQGRCRGAHSCIRYQAEQVDASLQVPEWETLLKNLCKDSGVGKALRCNSGSPQIERIELTVASTSNKGGKTCHTTYFLHVGTALTGHGECNELMKDEPPRLPRRLQSLRGWSHEEVSEVFARGARARREIGF